MNQALERLANELDLANNERLRLEFGHACASRVAHFLEDPAIIDCLHALGRFLEGTMVRTDYEALVADAARLANRHPGSASIDGSGHAAVSASYAVAHAVAGKALQAADYSAYAAVYGQGGYGAVADRESFEPELAWQVEALRNLAQGRAPAGSG